MQANTIDEVIKHLDEIIAWSITNRSRMGYFAALYRKVTIQVKKGIEAGEFDDNPRMEKLDVIFANRYLAAFAAYRDGKPVTKSWKVAFDAATRWRPIVLQHLLIGMNAHINLDLGIAAAQVAPGPNYKSLHDDFNKINVILADLVNEVKDELSDIWPLLRLINAISGSAEDAIINFSMALARDGAWRFGKSLAPLNPADQAPLINTRDNTIALLGNVTVYPPPFISSILFLVRLGEQHSVRKNIKTLC